MYSFCCSALCKPGFAICACFKIRWDQWEQVLEIRPGHREMLHGPWTEPIMPLNGGSTLVGINLSTKINNCPRCLIGRERIDGMLLSVYFGNTLDTVLFTWSHWTDLWCVILLWDSYFNLQMQVKLFHCYHSPQLDSQVGVFLHDFRNVLYLRVDF